MNAEEAIAKIHTRFGAHPGCRALHAKGTVCEGTFTATPEAAALTRAAHMQGDPVSCLVRLSNGGGNPKEPDYAPDVRGLAVGFELPDGSRTDILGQTAPRFAVRSVEAFFDLLAASKPEPAALLKFPVFLARHPGVAASLPANLPALKPPPSYFAVPYYPVHAFKWTNADGEKSWIRYTWRPLEALPPISAKEAKRRGRDYLGEELAERLAQGSGEFELEVQIAGPGDDPDDPSSRWPDDRRRVTVGTLQVDAVSKADHADLIFDPMRLTDGIEPSDDPILRFRPEAYSASYELRTATES